MKTEKPWGYEEIIVSTPAYIIKELCVRAGHRTSLQYHNRKIETFICQYGQGIVYLDSQWVAVVQGGIIHVPDMKVHRIEAGKTSDIIILEVSSLELDDIVRLEDDYGRAEENKEPLCGCSEKPPERCLS